MHRAQNCTWHRVLHTHAYRLRVEAGGRVRWGRPLLSRPRGVVGSGPAAVLAVVECLSRPRFRVSASRGRAAGVSLGLNLNHGQDTRANRTRRWVWMVVRFVCVLRVSACALVCPVCVPAPPGVFLPVQNEQVFLPVVSFYTGGAPNACNEHFPKALLRAHP